MPGSTYAYRVSDPWGLIRATKNCVPTLGHEAPAALLGRLLDVGVGIVLRHTLQNLQGRPVRAFLDRVLVALPPAGAALVVLRWQSHTGGDGCACAVRLGW